MINLHDFDTVQNIGWVLLGVSVLNYFLPFKKETNKYLVGITISSVALIVFILNMFFNIKW